MKALPILVIGALLVTACAPVTAPRDDASPSSSSSSVSIPAVKQRTAPAREIPPAENARASCEAKCRDQYGGSGSAGFDACIRGCGVGPAAGAP